ncbi:unnamed protein product [Bursaphelenchus xylophilus]|uniref:(pine wood nematode) hypothetical protein n=1 Tax=Bursaphelenchus xylophilus TaxID=6326 RepID=A0A7I8XP10_BURXY|nr:unnamed protein product [Bursaphelenchus xylophilus]CAG9086795.1 unnamed protein product [Bursaphelenchus xylophilus]
MKYVQHCPMVEGQARVKVENKTDHSLKMHSAIVWRMTFGHAYGRRARLIGIEEQDSPRRRQRRTEPCIPW